MDYININKCTQKTYEILYTEHTRQIAYITQPVFKELTLLIVQSTFLQIKVKYSKLNEFKFFLEYTYAKTIRQKIEISKQIAKNSKTPRKINIDFFLQSETTMLEF